MGCESLLQGMQRLIAFFGLTPLEYLCQFDDL